MMRNAMALASQRAVDKTTAPQAPPTANTSMLAKAAALSAAQSPTAKAAGQSPSLQWKNGHLVGTRTGVGSSHIRMPRPPDIIDQSRRLGSTLPAIKRSRAAVPTADVTTIVPFIHEALTLPEEEQKAIEVEVANLAALMTPEMAAAALQMTEPEIAALAKAAGSDRSAVVLDRIV